MLRASRFARDRNAVAAIEFALLAIPFVTAIFFDFQLAMVSILQTRLEKIVDDSARVVMTNTARDLPLGEFKEKYVCPGVSGIVDCADVMLEGTPVPLDAAKALALVSAKPELTASNWCITRPSSFVLLRVGYEIPGFLTFFRISSMENATRNGQPVSALISNAQIRNEPVGDPAC